MLWKILSFIIWVACVYYGYTIGKSKGKPILGLLLGIFLGPIGVLIILLI